MTISIPDSITAIVKMPDGSEYRADGNQQFECFMLLGWLLHFAHNLCNQMNNHYKNSYDFDLSNS